MYEDMIHYVKEFLQNADAKAALSSSKFPFRDRFDHTLRVYKWALRINEVEKGDEEILSIAAIFHDVGKWVKNNKPHALVGSEICDTYLRNISYPEAKRTRVVNAIKYHSSKSREDLDLTLEDKILMDADMLDEVGATAVLWDSMATALQKEGSYFKAYQRHVKFFKSLDNHKKYIKTATGAKLYQERLDFLELFIDQLEFELGIK